jgi:hypothetical protein
LHIPFQLEDLRVEHQFNFFMGSDCHIETSYRLGNKQLGWTTSPNPAYRFVLIGLGFLLLNLWVHLCWIYTQVAHRGRRAFARSLFRQTRFLNFLRHALERVYGTVNRIRAPAAPRL